MLEDLERYAEAGEGNDLHSRGLTRSSPVFAGEFHFGTTKAVNVQARQPAVTSSLVSSLGIDGTSSRR